MVPLHLKWCTWRTGSIVCVCAAQGWRGHWWSGSEAGPGSWWTGREEPCCSLQKLGFLLDYCTQQNRGDYKIYADTHKRWDMVSDVVCNLTCKITNVRVTVKANATLLRCEHFLPYFFGTLKKKGLTSSGNKRHLLSTYSLQQSDHWDLPGSAAASWVRFCLSLLIRLVQTGLLPWRVLDGRAFILHTGLTWWLLGPGW